jgi:hypothetical protein
MVSVNSKALAASSLSSMERDFGADDKSSRPCRSPQRDGGAFSFDQTNE